MRVTYKEGSNRYLIITAVKKKKGWGCVNLQIEYDRESDALYIQLREAFVDDNIDIEEGVTVDLDEQRHIVGIEILHVSKKLSLEDIINISIENLPVDRVKPGSPG